MIDNGDKVQVFSDAGGGATTGTVVAVHRRAEGEEAIVDVETGSGKYTMIMCWPTGTTRDCVYCTSDKIKIATRRPSAAGAPSSSRASPKTRTRFK